MAQRLVRAKKKLKRDDIPYEVPAPGQLAERLDAVLAVLYLIFNEGYQASAGDDLMRTDLCEQAIALGRMVSELMPRSAETAGLVALMLSAWPLYILQNGFGA